VTLFAGLSVACIDLRIGWNFFLGKSWKESLQMKFSTKNSGQGSKENGCNMTCDILQKVAIFEVVFTLEKNHVFDFIDGFIIKTKMAAMLDISNILKNGFSKHCQNRFGITRGKFKKKSVVS